MLEASIFQKYKTKADFDKERQAFEYQKRQQALQEQLGGLQVQQLEQQVNMPKMPFEGTGLDVSAANEAYKRNVALGMDDAMAHQQALDAVLGSRQSVDPRGNVITRNPIFGMPPRDISQMPPREAIGQRMTTFPAQQPMNQAEADQAVLGLFGGDQLQPIEGMAQAEAVMPNVVEATPQPSQQIMIDPAAFGVTSPYAREDIAKAQALANIDIQKKQQEAELKKAQEAEVNKRAYDTFNIAIKNIESSMADTATNPLVGAFPAVTPEAQTAESSVSTMAPILKQLFRSSGEGVFTDKDQQLLLDMVPTRSDYGAARQNKINMIQQVVRSKLGLPVQDYTGFGEEQTPSSATFLGWE